MVRIKHRYLLIRFLYPSSPSRADLPTAGAIAFTQPTPDALTAQILTRLIRQGVSDLFGDYGAGIVGGSLAVKYLSTPTSTALIRVARECYRMVWAALTFVNKLPMPVDRPCIIRVTRVSGTIRKALESAVRDAQEEVWKAKNMNGDANRDPAPLNLVLQNDAEVINTDEEEDCSDVDSDMSS